MKGIRVIHRRRGLPLALALTVAIVYPGCDNDDTSSGNPCVEFAPAAVPAPQTVTAIEGQGVSCDVAVVDLVVTDVNDLFASSFDVTFDATRVVLVTVSTTNSVLTSDGAPVLRQVTTIGTGHVHVALTRSQVATGVDVVGGGTLATITFLRTGTGGTSPFALSDAELLDPSTPPAPIPGISFRGGTFQIFTE